MQKLFPLQAQLVALICRCLKIRSDNLLVELLDALLIPLTHHFVQVSERVLGLLHSAVHFAEGSLLRLFCSRAKLQHGM